MTKFLNENKLIFLLFIVIEMIFSLVIWYRSGINYPKQMNDWTAPLFYFFMHLVVVIFLFLLKFAYNRGFKAGKTGFYVGVLVLLFQHIFAWESISDEEGLFWVYFTFAFSFAYHFIPLWLISYFIVLLSKKNK
jgi:hypothetical protein